MEYVKNIEIYQMKEDLSIPLASDPNKIAGASIGSHVVVIEESVFVEDWRDGRKEQYALADCSASFIRSNPSIFQEIT